MWIIVLAIAAGAILGNVVPAAAAPTVNVPHYYIAKNTSQPFAIGVSDSGNATTEDIEGMTFTLQLDAGMAATPSIGSVDFLAGTVWSGHVSAANIQPSNVNSAQYKSFTLLTNTAGDYINANGTLATATLSALSAAPGDYAVKLLGTKFVGNDTQFTSGVGGLVPTTIANGTLTVVLGGDFNRDGQLSSGDLQTMLSALTDLSVYQSTFNVPAAELTAIGDLDGDGLVTNRDIQPLLNMLAAGAGSLQAVPEPPTVVLAAVLVLLFGVRSSRLRTEIAATH